MGKKKRRRKNPADLLVVPFNHRMTAAEKLAFDTAASIAGLSTSAWVRERLRAAATKELTAAGKKPAFLK